MADKSTKKTTGKIIAKKNSCAMNDLKNTATTPSRASFLDSDTYDTYIMTRHTPSLESLKKKYSNFD